MGGFNRTPFIPKFFFSKPKKATAVIQVLAFLLKYQQLDTRFDQQRIKRAFPFLYFDRTHAKAQINGLIAILCHYYASPTWNYNPSQTDARNNYTKLKESINKLKKEGERRQLTPAEQKKKRQYETYMNDFDDMLEFCKQAIRETRPDLQNRLHEIDTQVRSKNSHGLLKGFKNKLREGERGTF